MSSVQSGVMTESFTDETEANESWRPQPPKEWTTTKDTSSSYTLSKKGYACQLVDAADKHIFIPLSGKFVVRHIVPYVQPFRTVMDILVECIDIKMDVFTDAGKDWWSSNKSLSSVFNFSSRDSYTEGAQKEVSCATTLKSAAASKLTATTDLIDHRLDVCLTFSETFVEKWLPCDVSKGLSSDSGKSLSRIQRCLAVPCQVMYGLKQLAAMTASRGIVEALRLINLWQDYTFRVLVTPMLATLHTMLSGGGDTISASYAFLVSQIEVLSPRMAFISAACGPYTDIIRASVSSVAVKAKPIVSSVTTTFFNYCNAFLLPTEGKMYMKATIFNEKLINMYMALPDSQKESSQRIYTRALQFFKSILGSRVSATVEQYLAKCIFIEALQSIHKLGQESTVSGNDMSQDKHAVVNAAVDAPVDAAVDAEVEAPVHAAVDEVTNVEVNAEANEVNAHDRE